MPYEPPFEMTPIRGGDKSIFINGPHGIELELDRDDVDIELIDKLAPVLVQTLNNCWPTEKANKLAAERHEQP